MQIKLEGAEIPFNLNESIKVKLKESGYQILADSFNKTLTYSKYSVQYFKNKVDKDGYYRIQVWEFMQIFGPHIRLGMNPPFHLDVILLVNHR